MPKIKPKAIKTKVFEHPVRLTLKSVGRMFKSEGKTLEDAINKIKISNGARALSVITVQKGKVIKEKILNGAHTQGLFGQGSPTTRAIHLKLLKQTLGV